MLWRLLMRAVLLDFLIAVPAAQCPGHGCLFQIQSVGSGHAMHVNGVHRGKHEQGYSLWSAGAGTLMKRCNAAQHQLNALRGGKGRAGGKRAKKWKRAEEYLSPETPQITGSHAGGAAKAQDQSATARRQQWNGSGVRRSSVKSSDGKRRKLDGGQEANWYSRKGKKAEAKKRKWQREQGEDDVAHDSCEEPKLALNRISDSLRYGHKTPLAHSSLTCTHAQSPPQQRQDVARAQIPTRMLFAHSPCLSKDLCGLTRWSRGSGSTLRTSQHLGELMHRVPENI